MTRVILIRHGEPGASAQGTHYGQSDVDLSERGCEQSIAVAERLRHLACTAVWSSDLIRARYLADRIAEHHRLPVLTHPDLRERHVGELQGLTYAAAEQAFPEVAQRARDELYRPPGGENMIDLAARVVPALETIAGEHAGGHVVVAAHGGPIRAILGHVLGLPIELLTRLKIDYCGISEIELDPARPRVIRVNA